MGLVMNKRIILSLSTALLSFFTYSAQADYALNLQAPVTRVAHEIYDLHTLVLLVCLAIFVVVFGFMFYSLYKHRKSVGHQAVQFHEHKALEIVWTVIPALILIGMAYPATKTIFTMKDVSDSDMSIKVTGHQWKWEYEYMGEGVRFISNMATPQDQIDNKAEKTANYLLEVDNAMVVPTGKKVRLLMTADDVIHSWWVPQFGVKQDAIPGFIKEAWINVDKPGTYRGQCAELCGIHHGFMPIVVEAVPEDKYKQWLASKKQELAVAAAGADKEWTKEDLLANGKAVYEKNCVVCHQANGQGLPPTFPALTGGKIATGPIEGHLEIVLKGGKTVMPKWGPLLNDVEIASVITYERNALGNSVGDMLQPAQVKAAR